MRIIIFMFASLALISSCRIYRANKYKNFTLSDVHKLPSMPVQKSDKPFLYTESTNLPAFASTTHWLDTSLENTETYSFLVIRNDSILYEKYFGDVNKETIMPSFSVMKSYVSTLVGIAYAEGKISSLQDPMTKYLPEFLENGKGFEEITIQALLDMRTGINWDEGSYGLKDDAIMMGFRPNIEKYVRKITVGNQPVIDSFKYKSINTLLLSMIVARATGTEMPKYFEQKLWQPMGAQYNAEIQTDEKGFPIAYAGLNATARDFAKLGTLFLKRGNMNGTQVLPAPWVIASVTKDSMEKADGYHNQWWSMMRGNFYAYHANGILGQMIFVVPEKNIVIVRTGHFWRKPKTYLQAFARNVAGLF